MPMDRKGMSSHFNPERYGMIYCPVCKGIGKFFNGIEGGVVCKICGGFGLIRKEEKNIPDNWVRAQLPK